MTLSSDSLYTICFALPAGLTEDQAGLIAECLGEEGTLSTSLMRVGDPFHGEWTLQWLVMGQPDEGKLKEQMALSCKEAGVEIPNLMIMQLPQINWLEHSYRQFPPLSIDRFFIHGNHYDGDIPDGMIGLEIEAATAFGSGEHDTTAACLLLMYQLEKNGIKPQQILDMGCGSGILSIAAAKLWDKVPITAIDIDPEAIRVTNNHAAANGVDKRIMADSGDGFAIVKGNFDLIIANILPNPLKAMAPDMITHLKEDSHVILSGLLLYQAQAVLDVYESLGLKLVTRLDRGEWTALLLRL